MLPDWETNAVLISDLLPQRHPEIVRRLESILGEQAIPVVIIPGTADIWIRDAAPVQVEERLFTQFSYRPDYLRNGYEHLITGPEIFRKSKLAQRTTKSKLNIDGGNIVGTRTVAIVTEKIFTENSDRSRNEVREELRKLLHVKRLIDIPREPYDVVGHADAMLRFVMDDQIVLSDYRSVAPRLAERLEAVLSSNDLQFVRLPYVPEYRVRDGIPSAVGNYANFLRVGNVILVPAYGLPEDRDAHDILANQLPHCRVVSLPCRDLAEEGGVLNCVSWTIHHSATKPA